MKTLALPLALLAASPAVAHPGHLADAAGHDHWVAGAAIGAAIAVGLWGTLKDRRRKGRDHAEPKAADDRQDA